MITPQLRGALKKMKKRVKILLISILAILCSSTIIAVSFPSNNQQYKTTNIGNNFLTYTTWGGLQLDRAVGVDLDSDGNIILCGYSNSFNGSQVFLVKYNTYLTALWNTSWKINKFDRASEMIIDDDDNIFVTGTLWENSTITPSDYVKNVFLLKFDSAGDLLWNRTWTTITDENANSLALDQTGNVYITGRTTHPNGSLFILKYSPDGIYQWNSTYDSNNSVANDIKVNDLGEIFITGYTNSPHPKEILLVKFNSTGYALWNVTVGGLGSEDIGRGITLLDTDIYLVGTTESLATNYLDTIVLKFNITGHIQWIQIRDEEYGESIGVRPDGNIVIIGNYLQTNGIFAAEYSPEGLLRWNTSWSCPGIDRGYDLVASDKGFYVAGETTSMGQGSYDMLLLAYQDVTTVTITEPTTITVPEGTVWYPYDDDNGSGFKIVWDFPAFWAVFILLFILILIIVILLILLFCQCDIITVRRKTRRTRETIDEDEDEEDEQEESKPKKKTRRKRKKEKKPTEKPLTLESNIQDAPEVGPATFREFKRIGIVKVKDFMAKSPEEIVSALNENGYTRISVEDITRMQQETQMMLDIPGLRVHDAVMLHKVNVRSKTALSKQDQDELWEEVSAIVDDNHVRKFLRWDNLKPTYEEMAEWIELGKKALSKPSSTDAALPEKAGKDTWDEET
ncbi:MAG: DUF4332 domain-containing protein [Candidatus Heimdallarchaeota archaeon]|nr:DUF4332 domain-containing protein [Candidatus Heimdallarchaeota archaeon]